jgi:hypothetical protein
MQAMDSLSEIIQLYSKLACEPGADFEWGMGKENADRRTPYAPRWLAV